jgi:putative membrane protein
MSTLKILGAVTVVLVPCVASAHVLPAAESDTPSTEWLSVGVPLLLAIGLYVCGLVRSGRRSWETLAFSAGLLTLAIALLSPLDRWGAELFAAHMVQHEVLMLIAAPLLVLGRPLPIFLWAFPARMRASLGRVSRVGWVYRVWAVLTRPLSAWLLHALALWVWHAPPLFDAVLTNRGVHDLQHFTFLATALLFWSALLHARAREAQGAAIIYLFTTTVHSSVLGALITFGTRPWYQSYLQTAPQWGLTALEDQQLGGLIMWVPASFVYVGVALLLMARWLMRAAPSAISARPEARKA